MESNFGRLLPYNFNQKSPFIPILQKVFGDGLSTSKKWAGMVGKMQFGRVLTTPVENAIDLEIEKALQAPVCKVGDANLGIMTGACGSGKTLYAPMALAKSLGYRRVFILVPRVLAAQNAAQYYTKLGYKVVCRADSLITGNADSSKANVLISTYGSFSGCLSRNWVDSFQDFLWFIDEVHDISPELQTTFTMLINRPVSMYLMSATIPFHNFPSARPFSVDYWFVAEHGDKPGMKRLGSLQTNGQMKLQVPKMKDLIQDSMYGSETVFAIVGPSLSAARMFYQDMHPIVCRYVIGVSSMSLYLEHDGVVIKKAEKVSTMGLLELYEEIPLHEKVMFICTPVVEVGVTLPDLDHIVDCGSRYSVEVSKWHLMGTTLNVSTMVNTVVRPATYGESVQVAGRVGRTRSGTAIILGAARLAETVEDWGMRVTTDAQAVKAGQPPVWGVDPVDVSDELLSEVNKWLQRHKLSDKTTEEDRMLHRLVTNVERVGKDSKYLFKMKNKIGGSRSVTVTEILYDMSKGKLKSMPLRTIHGKIPRPTKADNIMSTTVKPVDAAAELKTLLSPPMGPISKAVSAAYKGKEREDVAPLSPSLDWALDDSDVTAVRLDWSQGQPPYRVFCKMGSLEGVIDPNNPMAQLDKEKELKAQSEALNQATNTPLPEGNDVDLAETDILSTSSEETVVLENFQPLSWLRTLYKTVMSKIERIRVICSNFLNWLI